MPTPDRILEGLAAVANEQTWLAVVWHIVLAGVIVALLVGSVTLMVFAMTTKFVSESSNVSRG